MAERHDPLRIAHCSLTEIASDPRILRQVTTQRAMGHDVVSLDRGSPLPVRTMTGREKLRRALAQGPAWVMPKSLVTFGQRIGPVNRALLRGLQQARPGLVHVHNPELLPAVARYAKQTGSPWIYDSHEYSAAERWESLAWRLVFPAFVRALERSCVPAAAAVTCVSDTLAGYLQDDLALAERPVVVRNVPDGEPLRPKPTDPNRILLHYHGLLNSGRGIMRLLSVMQHLPKRFSLRITGPVLQPGYGDLLDEEISKRGLTGRVQRQAAVPNDELIGHAAEADIGIFLFPAHTRHLQCALPNKLFDYAQAGLMVVAGRGQEVVSSIRRNANGIAVADISATAVAEQIAALDAADIDRFKAASFKAAQTDRWSVEQETLINLTRSLLGP